jgi:hypothetical protein
VVNGCEGVKGNNRRYEDNSTESNISCLKRFSLFGVSAVALGLTGFNLIHCT